MTSTSNPAASATTSARLTVVVPMYNSGATVGSTLDSVIAQTFTDWRLIVVNDGSTDEGPRIAAGYAARDRRIRVVDQANKGLAGARNTGLQIALDERSSFVHFLDADDWMAPDAYEHLLPAAQETGVSYGGYELCDPYGRSLGRQSPMSVPYVGLDEQIAWNRAATHAILLKTELLRDERFDETLSCVEDYDLWLRLAVKGVVMKGVERIICGYRLRPDSMSKKFAAMSATYERVLLKHVHVARERGWGAKIDLSSTRLARVMGSANLGYATMDALCDADPFKARAARLLDSRTHAGRFSPAEMAQAASTALVFGSCIAPDVDGTGEKRWLGELRRWFVRCADEGWIGFNDIEPSIAELAVKIVHPDAVTASMLDEAAREGAAERGVIVLGCERFGRRLARRAASRGWRVLVIDDRSSDAECACLESIGGVDVLRDPRAIACLLETSPSVPMLSALESRAVDDAVGARRSVIRWASHRDELGAANLRRMRAALSNRLAKAG